MAKRTYEGSDIEVTYDVKRCIHAEECVRGLPSVFDPGRRPWVDANAAPAEEIANAIHACPTGALRYRRLDGGGDEAPAASCTVRLEEDGPLYARGPLRVRVPGQDGEETVQIEPRAAFCRCGASTIKPFCDDSHQEIGFEAAGPVDGSRAVSGDALAEARREAGPGVTVTPHENGPFHFKGVLEIRAGGDGPGAIFVDPWLCRCGGSSNKPFCDGTHKEIGFRAEGF